MDRGLFEVAADGAVIDEITAYRLISHLSSDYVFSLLPTAEGSFELEWVSEGFQRVTGYTLEEVQAAGGWATLVDPSHEQIKDDRLASLAAGSAHTGVLKLVTKSAETAWVRGHLKPILDEDGTLLRIVGSAQDITEEQRAKELADRYHARVVASFEEAALGVAVLDLEGRLLAVNAELARMFGCAREEMLGLELCDFAVPEDQDEVRQLGPGLSSNPGGRERSKVRFRHKDGSELIGRITSSLVRQPAGESEFIVAQIADVTEHHQTLDRLTQSERLLADAERVAHIGSWQWELGPDRMTWSDEIYRIYDLDPNISPSYTRWLEGVHPEDRDFVHRQIQQALRDEQPYDLHFRIQRSDGSVRMVHARGELRKDESGNSARRVGTLHDVTEQFHAAAELEAHASLLAATLESTADGILVVDEDKNVLAFNQKFLHMWQVPDELIVPGGEPLLCHMQDQVVDRTSGARVRRYLSTDDAPVLDTLELIDGRVFERFQSPRLLAGRRAGVVLSFRDVTAARRAEKDLARRQKQLEEAQSMASIGSWEIDLIGGGGVVSDQLRRIFMIPDDAEVTQDLFWSQVHPEDRETLGKRTAAERESGGSFIHSFRIVRPDGSIRWMESSGRVELDAAGRPCRVVGADQDVTERKRAERLLACQAEVLRKVAMKEPLSEVLECIVRCVEREADGALCSIRLLEGGILKHRVAPSLPRSFTAALDDPPAGYPQGVLGDHVSLGKEVVSKDLQRDPRWAAYKVLAAEHGLAACWASPIFSQGREPMGSFDLYYRTPREPSALDRTLVEVFSTLAAVAIEVDRSERSTAEMEDHYRQAQKMQAVGQLAGGVAHDFNNLLQAISGSGSLLADLMRPLDPRREHVETVLAAAQKGAGLVRQLMTFARREPLTPRVLDVNRSVEEMEPLMRIAVGEAVELTLTLDPREAWTKMDPSSFEQVLLNLVGNARDAGAGRISVSVSRELDAVSQEGNWVVLAVKDDGSGMGPEVAPRVFEPFYTTKEPGKGTGLGLATVYGAVDAAGGHVRLHSAPDAGSTFYVYLPLEPLPDPVATGPEARTQPREGIERPGVILLAEDQHLVADSLCKILTRRGHRVLLARDGTEAVKVALAEPLPIDVVVTDVSMPGLTGPQVVRRLREQGLTFRTVYMSGYDQDTLDADEVETGDAYIAKPFGPDELSAAVEGLLTPPL